MAWLKRQSFLGEFSDEKLAALTVGIAGLGGGGSHVAQQLAHVGVGNFVLCDDDVVEDTNLNRLVGATREDLKSRTLKINVAKRIISGVQPHAAIRAIPKKWQFALDELRRCDIIVAGLDSYQAKAELERFCRSLLIPYVDMGMDVHCLGADYVIAGQVVLSSPDHPCLWCMGILNDELITQEAGEYGDAGGKPQVVWPNGVLASVAVGLVVQLVTPWHRHSEAVAYLEYDANTNTMEESARLAAVRDKPCRHYPSTDRGDPFFRLDEAPIPNDLETKAVTNSGPGSVFSWIRRLMGRKRGL